METARNWILGTSELEQLRTLAETLREAGVSRFRLGDLELELGQPAAPARMDELAEDIIPADALDDGRFDHVGIRLRTLTEDETNAI